METRGAGVGVNRSDLFKALCTGPACTLRLEVVVVVVGGDPSRPPPLSIKTVGEHSGGGETSPRFGERAGEHSG